MEKMRKCLACGKELFSRKAYCDEKCRHKHQYKGKEKTENVCEFCGKTFMAYKKGKASCGPSCREKLKRREATMHLSETRCVVCNKPTGSIKKKYCSQSCNSAWAAANPRYEYECQTCSAKFETNERDRKYCSRQCTQHPNAIPEHTCKNCGKTFKPRRKEFNTYCSRECAYDWFAKNRWYKYKCIVCNELLGELQHKYCSAECGIIDNAIECKYCQRMFDKRTISGRYCSIKCRTDNDRDRQQEYIAETERNHIKRKIWCRECGKVNILEYGDKRRHFCSEACSSRAMNRNKDNRVRNARRNGAYDNTITLAKLIERDEGICYICNMPVQADTHYNHDKHPTIEHVVPISKGGTHTWDNVRLACRQCNTRKSVRIYEVGAAAQHKTGQLSLLDYVLS